MFKVKPTMRVCIVLLFAVFGFGCDSNVLPTNVVAIVSPSPTPSVAITTPPEDVFIPWQQIFGTTKYRWNGKDLYFKRSLANEVAIFELAAKRYHASFEKEGGRCLLSNYFTPAAVVGDIVSYEHESGIICGTASGEWRYVTIDVAKPKRFLDLSDFFTDDQILRAFLADPQLSSDVQKSITERKLDAIPTTLKELSAFLTKYDYQIYNGNSYFQSDYLTRFAFHHVEGETICVRVSATSTSTAGRANHQYAEIFLPIPDKLRDALRKADAGNEGFLMKDSATKVGTKPAEFESRF